MAKGKSKGVIGEWTNTRGAMRLGVIAAAVLFIHNRLQKGASDPAKKDSLQNKVAGALGYTGAGIPA